MNLPPHTRSGDRPLLRPAAGRRAAVVLALCGWALLVGMPRAAQAQPFGVWNNYAGPTHGYVRIPHSPALNPTGAFTFEAWVNVTDADGCSSIAGKGYLTSWWIGICGTTLRSYLKGQTSQRNGGVIPAAGWTHVAVTYDGANRRHYVNGELIATFAETGALPANTAEVRIGSDVDWQHTPHGSMDEIRLWSVARTTSQLRATINVPLTSAQPGLIAVWAGGSADALGAHNGSIQGSGVTGSSFPPGFSCGSGTSTALCLQGRFAITARFRTGAPGTAEGTAQVVPVANPGSGLFWFFSPDNWEIMVKAINGCGLNNRYWIFSAATTNVFYRLEVLDVRGSNNKVYFNFPGPPAPAVTDTDAFATCP